MSTRSDVASPRGTTLRPYRREDAAITAGIFQRAIRELAQVDYDPEQIAAWSRDDIDLDAWHAKRAAVHSFIAERGGRVVGWSDADDTGYMDMLFVDPSVARQGVASQLLDRLVRFASEHEIPKLSVHASLTARPFYEHHGFAVVREQRPIINGVALTNFAMERDLVDRNGRVPGQGRAL